MRGDERGGLLHSEKSSLGSVWEKDLEDAEVDPEAPLSRLERER